jgi:hypothetical protein
VGLLIGMGAGKKRPALIGIEEGEKFTAAETVYGGDFGPGKKMTPRCHVGPACQ